MTHKKLCFGNLRKSSYTTRHYLDEFHNERGITWGGGGGEDKKP